MMIEMFCLLKIPLYVKIMKFGSIIQFIGKREKIIFC